MSEVTPGTQIAEAQVRRFGEVMKRLREEIAKIIVGQDDVVDHLLVTTLVGGHCLITGLPGTAKTLMVKSLADALGLTFKRIQFTPDLMPTDVTGTDVIEEDVTTGRRTWTFVPGPIFTHILLADEINRTPPKTQSALLEAMQELSVTVRGHTYRLDPPFLVLATQNPIELEGTYPLPEAQLDRFIFNVVLDYLSAQEEEEVVKRNSVQMRFPTLQSCTNAEEIMCFQELVRQVPVSDDVYRYAVELVRATRPHEDSASSLVKQYVNYGASVRAAIYLTLGGKARALLNGRYHVERDDVNALVMPVLRHRVLRNYHAEADGVEVEEILTELVASLTI
ncbi:MAG: MoxR family ATPase [Pseudomonadales bacterium]